MDILSSSRALKLKSPWFSIITCSYNRSHTIDSCYKAVRELNLPQDKQGNPVTFEWIIVDDGSTDDTAGKVEKWIKEDIIPIIYIYQPNKGKHVASNNGISRARGYAVIEYDSDDIILPDALLAMYNTWQSLPHDERPTVKGVTGRCIDSRNGKMIGKPVPYEPFIVSPQDMRFKYHIDGEMFGFTLRSIMLEHPYPVFDGSTKFCPESIVIFEIGKRYREAVINTPVRIYTIGNSDSITTGGSRNRASQNYHLWKYEVNNLVTRYIFRSPVSMLKAVVGISMDGFRTGRSIRTIINDVTSRRMKLLVAAFIPAGYILSLR